MGLIDDDGVAALGQIADLLCHEGKLLKGSNNDGYAGRQRLGELRGIHVDLLYDSLLVLELTDCVLKLLVEHYPVGHDDDRIENLLVLLVVKARHPVDQPGN